MLYVCNFDFPGQQGEGASSFLAMLASSSTEEMEAELKERVESSCKQASCVVEICESLKRTVDQLKKDLDSNSGERCIVGLIILVYSAIVDSSLKMTVCVYLGWGRICELYLCVWENRRWQPYGDFCSPQHIPGQ